MRFLLQSSRGYHHLPTRHQRPNLFCFLFQQSSLNFTTIERERRTERTSERDYQNKKETKNPFPFCYLESSLLLSRFFPTTTNDEIYVDQAPRRRDEMAVVETPAPDLALSDVNINWDRSLPLFLSLWF